FRAGYLQRGREPGALFLAREGHGDDSAGTGVKHILTDDDDRAFATLLVAANRVHIGPENVAPQYSGHSAASPVEPSSASRCSNARSSLAHSRARRPCSNRSNLSRMASCTAWLRLLNRFPSTSWSKRVRRSRGMVMAILAVLISSPGMTIHHTALAERFNSKKIGRGHAGKRRATAG